jgi:hypothetical protein
MTVQRVVSNAVGDDAVGDDELASDVQLHRIASALRALRRGEAAPFHGKMRADDAEELRRLCDRSVEARLDALTIGSRRA